jgi:hypothetical protein
MQPDQGSAALAADIGADAREGALLPGAERLAGSERHQVVQQALADVRALARLQADVLARLDDADRVGDDETVLRCHAELDHVMARMSEADQVRTGVLADSGVGNDLTCAGCGAAAEPVYERPRLLAYRCAHCGWQGDDPAAQAELKRAEALATAARAVERAVPLAEGALASFGQQCRRGKQGKRAHAEGVAALRELHEGLAAAGRRLRNS